MKEKLKEFYCRKGMGLPCTIALLSGLLSILILFGTVIVYDTKVKIGGESVKTYFYLSMMDLVDGSRFVAWPMILVLVGLGVGLACTIALSVLLLLKTKRKYTDPLSVVAIMSFTVGVVMVFLNKELFKNFIESGRVEIANFHDASLGWASAASMLASMLAVFSLIGASGYARSRSVKTIAEDGVLIAAAFVLNFIRIPIAPTAGSINLQMLPLLVIALRRGPLDGFVAGGIVYGLLTCLTDGYGLATYPFDYLVGFGSVAVLGFFRRFIFSPEQTAYNVKGIVFLIIGVALSTFVRFVGSCTSSMVLYGYDLQAAMIYNYVYVFISGGLALAVLLILYGPLVRVNRLFPSAPLASKSEEE